MLRKWRRGSAVVDYLMMTAVVAGVAVPVVLHYFGEPIIRTLSTKRQGLVNFIAQNNPRPTVPPEWFRIEKQGNTGSGTANVTQPTVTGPGAVSTPTPTSVPNLPNPPNVTVANGGGTGSSTVGGTNGGANVGGNGGGGGAGVNGGFGAGGGGGSGSGKNGGDSGFFSDGSKGEGTKAAEESTAGSGGPTYGKGSGGSVEGNGDDFNDNEFAAKARPKGKEEAKDAKKEGGETGKRENIAELTRAQEEVRNREHQFDWWLLLKIIILILIGLFLVLIAVSNARKS